MSRHRASDFIRIGLVLAAIAIVVFSYSSRRTPFSDEEKETWDATALFLAGLLTVSQSSLDENVVLLENFRANYAWIRDVFLPHLRGTPKHPWTSCPDYCIPAAKKLTQGDEDNEKRVHSALDESQSRHEER